MITQSTCGQKVPPFNNQSFCFVFISVEWKITPVKQGVKYEVPILPGRIPGGNIQSSVPQFSACHIIAKHFTTHPAPPDILPRVTKIPPYLWLLLPINAVDTTSNSHWALQVWSSTQGVHTMSYLSKLLDSVHEWLNAHGVGVHAFRVNSYEDNEI